MSRGKNMCGIADCASYPDITGSENLVGQEWVVWNYNSYDSKML